MVIQFLIGVLVCVSLAECKSAATYRYTTCAKVPEETERWTAAVTLTHPLDSIQVVGGDVNIIRDDGLYLEILGTAQTSLHHVCIEIHGTFSGESPVADVRITPLSSTQAVATREIRSLRVRRAQQIWHVSSVPVTTNKNTLLASFQPFHHQWGDDSLSGTTTHSSAGELTVHYAKGSYSQTQNQRGVGWFTTPNGLPSNTDDLVLHYDIYFDNFGFGKMGKLPGLYGGVTGEGAYLCSGGNNPSSCFSLRMMWRSGGDGELYAYVPSNQESGFNNRPDVIANSDYGQSIGRGKIKFQNGVWQTVTQQVHLNSIGHTDGWVKFCNQISGQSQQCYTASNLRMRNSADHHLRGLFFSTFFGGSQPDDAAPNDCRTHYKELRIEIPDGVVVG
jgi:hypothetical protein